MCECVCVCGVCVFKVLIMLSFALHPVGDCVPCSVL